MKQIVALETFEQGLSREDGGALKMFKGSSITATEVDGVLVADTPKRHRLSKVVVDRLVAAGLVRVGP